MEKYEYIDKIDIQYLYKEKKYKYLEHDGEFFYLTNRPSTTNFKEINYTSFEYCRLNIEEFVKQNIIFSKKLSFLEKLELVSDDYDLAKEIFENLPYSNRLRLCYILVDNTIQHDELRIDCIDKIEEYFMEE